MKNKEIKQQIEEIEQTNKQIYNKIKELLAMLQYNEKCLYEMKKELFEKLKGD